MHSKKISFSDFKLDVRRKQSSLLTCKRAKKTTRQFSQFMLFCVWFSLVRPRLAQCVCVCLYCAEYLSLSAIGDTASTWLHLLPVLLANVFFFSFVYLFILRSFYWTLLHLIRCLLLQLPISMHVMVFWQLFQISVSATVCVWRWLCWCATTSYHSLVQFIDFQSSFSRFLQLSLEAFFCSVESSRASSL